MPYTYPPAPPTVTSDGILTISRFLNSPTLVERRLRTLAENRFIADTLLSGRVTVSGGAIQYEQNESIFTDRVPEAISPGGDYPITPLAIGPSLIAAVKKWGLDAFVTDEAIKRQQRNPVDRALTKLVNGVVKQVDTVALAAIAAAVTQTTAVGTAWTSSTVILRDILKAKAVIAALDQGYDVDTLVVNDLTGAILASDPTIAGALRREDGNAPVYTGMIGRLGGLDILVSSHLPVASTAWVLDRKVLGGMGDEEPLGSKSIRDETNEKWRLRAKRITTPFVMEPAAALKLTGV